MINTLNTYSLRASYVALSFLAAPKAFAGTPDIFGDVPDIGGVDATDTDTVRTAILDILGTVLNFLALIAVIVIVIAGIRLILSQGEETEKDKAKKTIFYAIIGLVVVLLAQAIVGLIESVGKNVPN
ncbi:MAG: pilin [bacterium]|nr:pilin [bacterium]